MWASLKERIQGSGRCMRKKDSPFSKEEPLWMKKLREKAKSLVDKLSFPKYILPVDLSKFESMETEDEIPEIKALDELSPDKRSMLEKLGIQRHERYRREVRIISKLIAIGRLKKI